MTEGDFAQPNLRITAAPPLNGTRMTSDNATPAIDTNEPVQDENKLIAERREKLKALRGQGIAFPNDFKVDSFAGDLQTEFADKDVLTAEAIVAAARRVKMAGRIVL